MFSNNGILSKKQTRRMASVQFFAVAGVILMMQYNRIPWQLFALALAGSIAYGYVIPSKPYWSQSFRWLKMLFLCMTPAIVMLGLYTFLVQKHLLPEQHSFWILLPLALLSFIAGRKSAEAIGRLFEVLYVYIAIIFLVSTIVFLGQWGDTAAICNTLFQLAMVCGAVGFISQSLHRWMQLGGKSDEA